jgi:hypothetical protein
MSARPRLGREFVSRFHDAPGMENIQRRMRELVASLLNDINMEAEPFPPSVVAAFDDVFLIFAYMIENHKKFVFRKTSDWAYVYIPYSSMRSYNVRVSLYSAMHTYAPTRTRVGRARDVGRIRWAKAFGNVWRCVVNAVNSNVHRRHFCAAVSANEKRAAYIRVKEKMCIYDDKVKRAAQAKLDMTCKYDWSGGAHMRTEVPVDVE